MAGGVTESMVQTRYIYNTAADKKQVQELIASGRKALVVARQFKNSFDVKIKSRDTRIKPYTSAVSFVSHITTSTIDENKTLESVTGVFGPVTRHGAEVSVLGPDQNIALWVVMLK